MQGGLFLSHLRTPRVMRHFDRLVEETSGLVEWTFAYNSSPLPNPDIGRAYPEPGVLMPRRHAQMMRVGSIIGGFADTLLFPCVAVNDHAFVWTVEFDVDFSGSWRRFFEQYADDGSDLLATTFTSRSACPDWFWWQYARSPRSTAPDDMRRGFLPIMRVSKRFVDGYVTETNEREWMGHYEFTIPTIAHQLGYTARDLKAGRVTDGLASPNYTNTPANRFLMPGTFRWRPPLTHYFHEDPSAFHMADKLYHPVKPA